MTLLINGPIPDENAVASHTTHGVHNLDYRQVCEARPEVASISLAFAKKRLKSSVEDWHQEHRESKEKLSEILAYTSDLA